MQAFSLLPVQAASEKDGSGVTASTWEVSLDEIHTLSERMCLELTPLNVRVLTIIVRVIESNLRNNEPCFRPHPSSLSSYREACQEVC